MLRAPFAPSATPRTGRGAPRTRWSAACSSCAPAERTTLRVALGKYLEEVGPTKRATTLATDTKRARILDKHLGAYSLAAITAKVVAASRDARLDAGKSSNSVRLELALLSHLYTTAIRKWGLGLTYNQVAYLRESEVLSVQHRNRVDLARRIVRVEGTKNGNSRLVPLSRSAVDVFNRNARTSHVQGDAASCCSSTSPYVISKIQERPPPRQGSRTFASMICVTHTMSSKTSSRPCPSRRHHGSTPTSSDSKRPKKQRSVHQPAISSVAYSGTAMSTIAPGSSWFRGGTPAIADDRDAADARFRTLAEQGASLLAFAPPRRGAARDASTRHLRSSISRVATHPGRRYCDRSGTRLPSS